MKGIIIREYGSPVVLEKKTNLPKPRIHDNQALVKIHAAGINPVDWKIRRGDNKIFFHVKLPFIPGSDFAGEIKEIGSNVNKFRVNDKVYGFLPPRVGGAYAEYASVNEEYLALKPENISFEEAASFPLASLTAFQALIYKGRLKPGDLVLINGAAGGVGSFAVQIAKAYGTLVTGICSREKVNFVKSLGADEVIDYKKTAIENIEEQYDIIFDTIGNLTPGRWKKILGSEGIYISTLPSPSNILSSISLSFQRLMGKKQRATSVMVKSWGKDLKQISDLVSEERVFPTIEKIFSLDEVIKAHEQSEGGRVKGKLVMRID
jgi:NADPH:quinone reductase-like Zn-dependent oxidoreductase